MTIDDKKDLEYVDYKVKYQEAENSCLERVSPGNCFFMHFRTVAGHMVLRSLYNSSCTTIPIAGVNEAPAALLQFFNQCVRRRTLNLLRS